MAPFIYSHHPSGSHTGWRLARLLRFLLPLLGLAVAIWACGATPPFTNQPGGDLTLEVTIHNQFVVDQPNVMVTIQLLAHSTGVRVLPGAQTRITCNGVDVTPSNIGVARPCPRQPAGGAYHIAYTDGQGATTTATVQIPTGALMLLSPRAGETVRIPTNGMLLLQFNVPTAPPGGTVTLNSAGAWCGTPPASDCGLVVTDGVPEDLTAHRGVAALQLTGYYGSFQPGPGIIGLDMSAQVLPEPSSFAATTATFTGLLDVPITWVR
jgi:hypothetical protein